MNDELKSLLDRILDYVIDAEVEHYEESGEPENHIYALALEAKVALKLVE